MTATWVSCGITSLSHLYSLCPEFRIEKALSRNIAAWPRDAGDDSVGDGIALRCYDNRDCRRCRLCGKASRRSMRDNQVHFGTNQVSGQFRKSLVVPLCKAVDDGNVRALDITEVAQT